MVAGVLAIDLINCFFSFTPLKVFTFNSTDTEFTDNYFDDLIEQIQREISRDIGQCVVISPASFSSSQKKCFKQKLDDVGIMSTSFVQPETLFIIGGLSETEITVAKNETVAVFYFHNSHFVGDQWIKSGSNESNEKIIFQKRIYFSKNKNGFDKVFAESLLQKPNHILISDKITDPAKYFPNENFNIFGQDEITFLLFAALIKARILMKEEGLKVFDAEDIGDMQISMLPKHASAKNEKLIGISIGSDTFSIAKYSNGKSEIIKNAKNEEIMKCTVFWKNGQLFVDGNHEGAKALEYSIDLLGAQSIEPREPFTKLELAENEDAPNTKVCYNIDGKIINAEKVALKLLKHIKSICGNDQSNAKIIFSLSSEIKNDLKKQQVFLQLAKEAGLEASGIVETNLALCLGESQKCDKKENGIFFGICVSDNKVDTVLFRFEENQILDFKEASRNLPETNPANREFVIVLREHLSTIAKTAFDVLKALNIDRTDVDEVLLNYTGKFKETTKEFLQRMFLEKKIVELETSLTVTALGAAVYGLIDKK